MGGTATARACSNIAFIKYWGNVDDELRIPANSSISMNLRELYTDTTVSWDETLKGDTLVLNGEEQSDVPLARVSEHLSMLRKRLNISAFAHVESKNNFPMGAGIASSASAFAALTLAAVAASDSHLKTQELSTLARIGSGSASRSIPNGYVQWHQGRTHETSFAESIADANHWDLCDVIAVVNDTHKSTTSKIGHTIANTSDLQVGRLERIGERFASCRQAILERDFQTLAQVTELDSNLMHSVMMTSKPPLLYWESASIAIMKAIPQWREEGIHVCYTLDAGPNVHCICVREHADEVSSRLKSISSVLDVLRATPGDGAKIISENHQ